MNVPLDAARVAENAPFSFVLGGQSSAELLPKWSRQASEERPEGAQRRASMWTDPRTGLRVTCEVTLHDDFPAVDWVLYFENGGNEDTPILENVLPLDTTFAQEGASQKPVLHYARGSTSNVNDFEPLDQSLGAGEELELAPRAGRSSDPWFPFFNLDLGGAGVLLAVGWSGQWQTTFRGEDGGVRVGAGMQDTHLVLHPGERIRTPRILLVGWTGRVADAQNLLRRVLLQRYVPKLDGSPLVSPISSGNWGAEPAHQHLETIKLISRNKLPYDYYWVDAGWYGQCEQNADVFTGNWARNVGSWDVNQATYPDGMQVVSDAARQAGMGYLLWFEPERAHEGSYLFREHPEWLLGDGEDRLFNFGDPDAWSWMTEHVSRMIKEAGIDVYRNDYNIDPLPFWRAADEPNRRGMAEIRWVEGFYAYWDELVARHPGLIIDDCAQRRARH